MRKFNLKLFQLKVTKICFKLQQLFQSTTFTWSTLIMVIPKQCVKSVTPWKVSEYGVFFLVRIFPYSDWIRRFTPCSVDNDRNRICRTGCNLLVACHASNTRRGGVYIYFKHHLPAIKRNKLYCLKECLFTELKLGKKQYFFHMHIYITSSQTSDEFENSVWTLTYSYLIIAILIYDSCWCSC